MKTPREVIREKGFSGEAYKEIVELMEEYADQFKYDYSKECKCDNSTGQTWCCNVCGLPYSEPK